ncbi:MAG: site-specific tyrosine recombinase XerD [Pyrinomonadaceae bacterium]
MPPQDLLKKYHVYLQVERGLASNSLNSYARDLRKLEAFAVRQGLAIQSLCKQHLIDWIKLETEGGAAPGSIQRRVSAIKGFYNFLQRDGLIEHNPAADLSFRHGSTKIPRFLTEEEVESLINVPDLLCVEGLRDRAILDVFYATGLRVSELVNLKVVDIELDRALLRCKGKGSKQRIVPLGRTAVGSLGTYLRVRAQLLDGKKAEQVFLRTKGRPLTRHTVWRLLKKYAQQAGLAQVNPHSLRHSFATHLINRGADSRTVQILLGHSDISTTQIYTHISNPHLAQTIEKFHPRSKK